MKRLIYLNIILVALLACAVGPAATELRGGNTVRCLTESIVLGSTPGSGGGISAPAGIFGADYMFFSGSSRVYSYSTEDWPDAPPTSYNDMGPGSVGTNGPFSSSGSGRVSGYIMQVEGASFAASGTVRVGTKLDPPRDPERASNNYESGTPARLGDSGYTCTEEYIPQWDMDEDGDTDGSDYDWVIQNGGFEGGGSTIPFTQAGDTTIRVDDHGEPGEVAEMGKSGDYDLDQYGNFLVTGSTSLHFTGSEYRFNDFRRTGSGELYFGTGGNDTNFFAVNHHQSGSGDLIIGNSKKLTLCVRDWVDISGSGKFNEDGNALQFDVVSPATSVDISGSGDAVAGCFYFPNAYIDISGSGIMYMAIIAKGFNKSGSGKFCYPTDYEGPPGGGGPSGSTPANPPERDDWKEIISE